MTNQTPVTGREALEDFLIENPDLERLEIMLGEFNLFEALGVVRQELRHSDFLGFLLDRSLIGHPPCLLNQLARISPIVMRPPLDTLMRFLAVIRVARYSTGGQRLCEAAGPVSPMSVSPGFGSRSRSGLATVTAPVRVTSMNGTASSPCSSLHSLLPN